MTELLAPARDSLENKFRSSRFLAHVHAGTTALVCGSVGALAAYLINPAAIVPALIAAVSGKAVEVAARIICDQMEREKIGGSSDTRRAIMSHYSAILD